MSRSLGVIAMVEVKKCNTERNIEHDSIDV
jgi:hypothetical protein